MLFTRGDKNNKGGGVNMQTYKLKSYMALHGQTIVALAKSVGLSSKTMSEKINGRSDFTVREAKMVTELLKIENPLEIFFE